MSNKENKKLTDFDNLEQTNKKHRSKSKKLEKRVLKKRNKKKTKKERKYIKSIEKYIKKQFKNERKFIYFETLPFDLLDIEKYLTKLLDINPNANKEFVQIIKQMEESNSEIDISNLENKLVQGCLIKLFKKLRIMNIGFKNPFIFKLSNVKTTKSSNSNLNANKIRFTTEESEIIADSLESYSLFVDSFFKYIQYKNNKNALDLQYDKANDSDNQYKVSSDEDSNSNDNSNSSDLEDSNIDEEYDEVEKTVGNNAELINKTADYIMRNDNKSNNNNNNINLLNKKRKLDNSFNNNNEECYKNYKNLKIGNNIIISESTEINASHLNANNNIESVIDDEGSLIGPDPTEFLKNTMSIINNEDNDFEELINKTTTESRRTNLYNTNNKIDTKSTIENIRVVNKESYNRLAAEQEELMTKYDEDLKEYNKKNRQMSLLEEFQNNKTTNKNKKLKKINTYNNKNINLIEGIESKNTLKMLQQIGSLNKKFGNRERY